MKKFFLTMLLLVLITPFTVHSQNQAVHEVYAKAQNDAVDLVWSFNDIIHETMVVDFETADFTQAPFETDQTFPWEITESAYEGNYAIRSTCEGVNNGVSTIEVTVDVPFDATMSFWHKVDCEYYFDNAYFYIDGVERDLITGNVDWTYREFKVSKGTHTYMWSYRKDSDDLQSSADVYFVDNIVLYKRLDQFAGGWVHYDDGHFVQEIGSQSYNVDWGICFPNTEEYAGYNLTKVATYNNDLPATVKANIYFGGVDAPQTLVHSQEFKLKGTSSMVELELNYPIPLSGTEPLWITFHNECSENAYVYPATGCNFTGNENSDWVSWDKGANWEHLAASNVNLTWMVRGYLENSNGERTVLSKSRNAQEYKVYRRNNITGEETLLAENITDTTYTDATWTSASFGSYQYGVAAVYADGDAEITWSNTIAKDVYTPLTVNVTTNSNDAPAGARVKFINLTEPGQGFDYKVTLDETGVCTFERFRKGNYKLTVTLEGYEQYVQEIEIVDTKDVAVVLNEIKATVENLYVSPTGWAMWENANFDNGGGTFFFDFEDGSFEGWTTVDADEDGLTWRITTDIMGPGNGYNKSKYCVISQSYSTDSLTPETAALKPDNYMITAEKYLITESSELSYYVCAQDETCPAEHYAVMISTTDNDVNSFETVWEETMSRGAATRAQGAWYKRTIDLSKYAGQEVYVAFRHFNTVGQFYIDVDNIALVNNAKSSSNSRSLNGYIVKLNDNVVAENIKDNFYQFEDLTAGESYKATVIANYTTGESEAAEYTWTYASPSEYAGVKSLEGRNVAGKAFVEWTFEGDEETGEAET
ncbi:MAG: choice-of-anchor J domain-containing protein, partial [Bacteroidales bacterium]|nr:choice-of-anchor J domain-containing protein [Bacteroidales bacterium]